ncbi:flavin reductase family protein [Jatrophihabitans sp.]|uniref:flavin reductase family protein n=1 Tax=Jatrophihabitans sp. TaxID=1932789 RepID=UPI002C1BBF1D|nr:flavin reductase family protein [Jatrophihabitans sp.]
MALPDSMYDTGLTPPAGEPPVRNPQLDRTGLRRVFGRFTTGVTVVTTGGSAPHGMTANSFTSVSLSPPLVLICVLREAAMHEAVLEHKYFAVSVLSADQEDLARYFADRHRPRGIQQFDLVDWFPGRCSGSPLVAGALAWLECSLTATYDGGDHSIFLGEVLDVGLRDTEDALLFYNGVFHGLHPTGV